jgi:hypothetical protein
MSPAKTRKKGAKKPDFDGNIINTERETALSQPDTQSGEQAADALTGENDVTDGDSVEERIRRRAYELYCSRGQRHGGELGDWFEAERQLRSSHRATERVAPRVPDIFGDEPVSEVRP